MLRHNHSAIGAACRAATAAAAPTDQPGGLDSRVGRGKGRRPAARTATTAATPSLGVAGREDDEVGGNHCHGEGGLGDELTDVHGSCSLIEPG
jgi:hypothetical protein